MIKFPPKMTLIIINFPGKKYHNFQQSFSLQHCISLKVVWFGPYFDIFYQILYLKNAAKYRIFIRILTSFFALNHICSYNSSTLNSLIMHRDFPRCIFDSYIYLIFNLLDSKLRSVSKAFLFQTLFRQLFGHTMSMS